MPVMWDACTGTEKIAFGCRNWKGQLFGILCNDYIKVHKETSIYIHDNVNKDFRQFLKLEGGGLLHNV